MREKASEYVPFSFPFSVIIESFTPFCPFVKDDGRERPPLLNTEEKEEDVESLLFSFVLFFESRKLFFLYLAIITRRRVCEKIRRICPNNKSNAETKRNKGM